MDADRLNKMLGSVRHSVVRLETRGEYAVGGAEAERLAAFRDHQARPERSVRTNGYLRQVAAAVLRGRQWRRVRVLDDPLTEYQRYQLAGYVESAAAGEEVLIARRTAELAALRRDFWLFDLGTRRECAVFLDYTDAGEFAGATFTREAAELARCREEVGLAAQRAEPLNVYLAAAEERQAA